MKEAISTVVGLPAPEPAYGTYALKGLSHRMSRWAQRQPDTWLGKRWAYLLRKLVLKSNGKIVDGDLWGLKVRWYPTDNITDREAFFLSRAWDPEERAFQAKNLPEDGVFLDVGANSGLYTLLALQKLSEQGTVIALEPNPEMFSRMATNVGLNAPKAQVRLFNVGVAEKSGSFTLNVKGTNLGGASLMDRPAEFGQVTVECHPLEAILNQAGVDRVDFMKIDVEGYEATALNPFFATAPRSLWPKFVNIESPEGIDWEGLGYEVVLKTRLNTMYGLKE